MSELPLRYLFARSHKKAAARAISSGRANLFQSSAGYNERRSEAGVVRRSHDTDEMLATNVGGNNAAADHPPRELVARKKVILLGRAATPRGRRRGFSGSQPLRLNAC
jgi:hypothetical protein